MKFKHILAVFCAVTLFYQPVIECYEQIIYTAVIYRHGDRTPVDSYPNDPYKNESIWPVKFGELTNTGKLQHYKLGQWLRNRYTKLVSSFFDPAEVLVRSTDVDRTLMSALANLAGFFPPIDKAIWKSDFYWQPIPVHTQPEQDDNILAMKKKCPNYDWELNSLKNSNAYKTKLKTYEKLMQYLSINVGRNITDYYGITDIYSILKIEKLYNLTLPKWTDKVFPDQMKEPACYSFAVDASTKILARLKVGPLVNEILKNMLKAMHTRNSRLPDNEMKYNDVDGVAPLKLHMYSGHDMTVANVLNALQIFDNNCPEYTATVLIELVYDPSALVHFVKVFYRNTPNITEPVQLEIPNCGLRCPLEQFAKIYKHLLIENWEKECNSSFDMMPSMYYGCGLAMILCMLFCNQIRKTKLAKEARRIQEYSGYLEARKC